MNAIPTTYATKFILVSAGARGPGLQRMFGSRPLVLRRSEARRAGWWGTVASPNLATFNTEREARSWLHTTFTNPIDHMGLATMEVQVVRQVDERAKARDAAQ